MATIGIPEDILRVGVRAVVDKFSFSLGSASGWSAVELMSWELLPNWTPFLWRAVAGLAGLAHARSLVIGNTSIGPATAILPVVFALAYRVCASPGGLLFAQAFDAGMKGGEALLLQSDRAVFARYFNPFWLELCLRMAVILGYSVVGFYFLTIQGWFRWVTRYRLLRVLLLSPMVAVKLRFYAMELFRLLVVVLAPAVLFARDLLASISSYLAWGIRLSIKTTRVLANSYRTRQAYRRLRQRIYKINTALQSQPPSSSYYADLNSPNQNIRVLVLHPVNYQGCGRTPVVAALIQCSTSIVAVSDIGNTVNNGFDAVSYRWPSEKSVCRILIDDRVVMVPATLLNILTALRHERQPRHVWIDALCINQGDSEEKEYQIGLMRDVYRGADRVVAWLGDSGKGSGGLTVLKRLARGGVPGPRHLEHIIHSLFPFEVYSWLKVYELFGNDYFHRIWILQEVALGKSVVLKYGPEEMDWAELAPLLSFFHSPEGERFLREPAFWTRWWLDPAVTVGVVNALTMASTQLMMCDPPSPEPVDLVAETIPRQLQNQILFMNTPLQRNGLRTLPLDFLLGLGAPYQSTWPEDRIYGVKGLADVARVDPPVLYGTTPQETAGVFQDLARSLLTNENELLFHFHLAGIGYHDESLKSPVRSNGWVAVTGTTKTEGGQREASSQHPPVVLELPSWVPEWHRGPLSKPAIQGALYMAGTVDPSTRRRFYSEPGDPQHSMRIGLSCVGAVRSLGQKTFPVAYDGDLAKFRRQVADFVHEAQRMVLVARQEGRCPYGSQQLAEDAMWRTLLLDCGAGEVPSLPPLERDELGHLKNVIQRFCGGNDGGDATTLEEAARTHRAMFYLGRLSWKRFCLSEHGHMGILPHGTVVGDELVIIWGLQTPFVIRRGQQVGGIGRSRGGPESHLDTPSNHIIGSCYLHGLMLGEATQIMYPAEVPDLIFE